jgi:signal transduction histidine kinase
LTLKTFERAIESIYRNANSQTQLISDLLDVSRIISNKLTLNVSQVNLPSVIEMALDTISPEAQAKGVHLQLTMEPDFPQLSGDAERLQQIIWNLLSNAIKFTPRDGTVHVRLRMVNSEAEISVADSALASIPSFFPMFLTDSGRPTRLRLVYTAAWDLAWQSSTSL